MILHMPHSSIKMLDGIHVNNLQENLNLYTDWYIDELFSHVAYDRMVFPYSRFVCDVERLNNDPMEKYGLGKFYTKDIFGEDIIREKDYDYLYDEFHKEFNIKTNFYTGYFKLVFIVDCHSFNEYQLYFEQQGERPDICLGVNDNTPLILIEELKKYFEENDLKTFINFPYSGSILPSWFLDSENVNSIMIEVNKKIYLTDKYLKNDNFEKIKDILTGGLNIIYEYTIKN